MGLDPPRRVVNETRESRKEEERSDAGMIFDDVCDRNWKRREFQDCAQRNSPATLLATDIKCHLLIAGLTWLWRTPVNKGGWWGGLFRGVCGDAMPRDATGHEASESRANDPEGNKEITSIKGNQMIRFKR